MRFLKLTMGKISNQFMDEIPLMIERACRLNNLTRRELGEALGYVPSTMSRLASGEAINGMPLGKLAKLMDLANCRYEWKRKE